MMMCIEMINSTLGWSPMYDGLIRHQPHRSRFDTLSRLCFIYYNLFKINPGKKWKKSEFMSWVSVCRNITRFFITEIKDNALEVFYFILVYHWAKVWLTHLKERCAESACCVQRLMDLQGHTAGWGWQGKFSICFEQVFVAIHIQHCCMSFLRGRFIWST